MVCGNTANRWYDSLMQVIVFNSGHYGISAEHSPVDGPIVARVLEHAAKWAAAHRASDAHPPSKARTVDSHPTPLGWNISQGLTSLVESAESQSQAIAESTEIHYMRFTDYGANFIKQLGMCPMCGKRLVRVILIVIMTALCLARTSPDSYFQMAIQLAYRKLHDSCTATYESAQTRQFYHGRTGMLSKTRCNTDLCDCHTHSHSHMLVPCVETCRTLSSESVAWTTAMLQESSHYNKDNLVQLLQQALAAHGNYMQLATSGKGVDRHLLGLRMCLEPDEKRPAIFDDVAYARSTNFRISTSNMSYPSFMTVFAPTSPDGYGFCYATRDNSLMCGISSYRHCSSTSAASMKQALEWSLQAMRKLFNEQAKL
jgi:carnitine O-acetyltransferase